MRALSFGGMAPKLLEQIPGLDPRFDKLADAITLLQINNILTEAETNRARSRLAKQVWREPAIDSVIETDYVGSTLELSTPIGSMGWNEATERTWPEGWRVPNRWELVRLYDDAIEKGHEFKDDTTVWSASPYHSDPDCAWLVGFYSGSSGAHNKSLRYVVRLVREIEK